MREKDCRIILVVAPTLEECVSVAKASGLDPAHCSQHLRSITDAYKLRGWSHGTPVLVQNQDTWGRSLQAMELGRVINSMLVTGRLRFAQDADIAAIKGEMV